MHWSYSLLPAFPATEKFHMRRAIRKRWAYARHENGATYLASRQVLLTIIVHSLGFSCHNDNHCAENYNYAFTASRSSYREVPHAPCTEL
jgi:hypothetical protein